MRHLWWLFPVAVFFLNPAFACSGDPEFQYGAADMRAAVGGDWSLTITPRDAGVAMQVTVHVDQATTTGPIGAGGHSLVRAARACGSRTLVKAAGACVDVSEMPLAVTYLSGDASFAAATMSGKLEVFGLTFAQGDLELKIGGYQVLAQVQSDGSVANPVLGPPGEPGSVTVARQ